MLSSCWPYSHVFTTSMATICRPGRAQRDPAALAQQQTCVLHTWSTAVPPQPRPPPNVKPATCFRSEQRGRCDTQRSADHALQQTRHGRRGSAGRTGLGSVHASAVRSSFARAGRTGDVHELVALQPSLHSSGRSVLSSGCCCAAKLRAHLKPADGSLCVDVHLLEVAQIYREASGQQCHSALVVPCILHWLLCCRFRAASCIQGYLGL